MKNPKSLKKNYNVLAVYQLLNYADRENFAGMLEAMANKLNWRLSTVRPGRFFSQNELVNENGEPYDGFILSMPGTEEAMMHIAETNKPTVLVNITDRRLSARTTNIASVWLDNADIGRRGARHLLGLGKWASVGFVHELGHPFYSEERMRAFREVMKRKGYETKVYSAGNGFPENLRSWVRSLPTPAAVMACSDMRAADLVNACKAEGLSVPSQIAVIGVDNDIAQHAKCGMSISSVCNNMRLVGERAVHELDFLFRNSNWKGRPHEILIHASGVINGESTAREKTGARLVASALKFISANTTKRISPLDVVAKLGCSRQLAELRFSQICGMTIHKTIERERMKEVKRRLHKHESVQKIVEEMQFTSANQLYRIFKRHFGKTIGETIC